MINILKRDNEDHKFLSIKSMMPKLIAEKHDYFMESYKQTGDSHFLNKKILHFPIDS